MTIEEAWTEYHRALPGWLQQNSDLTQLMRICFYAGVKFVTIHPPVNVPKLADEVNAYLEALKKSEEEKLRASIKSAFGRDIFGGKN